MTSLDDAAEIRRGGHGRSESSVDEALAESFPASDPPSWNSGVATTRPSAPAERGRGPVGPGHDRAVRVSGGRAEDE